VQVPASDRQVEEGSSAKEQYMINVRHGALLLALGVLTLTVGTVARVHSRHGSVTGNPKPTLPMSEDANWAEEQRGTARQSDDKLKEQLQNALNEDWELDQANIVVETVEHGVVTLSGRAEKLSYQFRAVELVANFAGVQRVKSRFQTQGTLSGIEIWKDERESTAHRGDTFWNAWMLIPIRDDGDEDGTAR
jgi:hypothetical protein